MRVLVDTPVWSLALRRRARQLHPDQERLTEELAELIREGRAQLLGPIRQELLSGIRHDAQFHRLRHHLRAFNDVRLTTTDYEEAARAFNYCRSRGVAGSGVGFLICAVALAHRWPVFTTDRDFLEYSKHLPITLHSPAAGRNRKSKLEN